MNIFLYRNALKEQSKNIAVGIREFLNTHGASVFSEDEDAQQIGTLPLSSADPDSIDFSITLGGDGTILRLVHSHSRISAPILGINLGSLGFMADIPITNIFPSLKDLLDNHFRIQEHMMIEGFFVDGTGCFAVNEITIHRGSNGSLIDIAIHVDGEYLNTFTADGVILSTACGSTAYSLSAGGPILTPELHACVIAPICPHTVSNKPIVLMPKKEIQFQYISELNPIEVSADGIVSSHLATGEVFYARPSERTFKLVKLSRHDYFATLRSKLGWVGRLRA